MNLLAKSCFAPGLIAMISNLIASAGEADKDQFNEDWLPDYTKQTDCLAKDNCGIPAQKPKLKLSEVQACCTPESGCC